MGKKLYESLWSDIFYDEDHGLINRGFSEGYYLDHHYGDVRLMGFEGIYLDHKDYKQWCVGAIHIGEHEGGKRKETILSDENAKIILENECYVEFMNPPSIKPKHNTWNPMFRDIEEKCVLFDEGDVDWIEGEGGQFAINCQKEIPFADLKEKKIRDITKLLYDTMDKIANTTNDITTTVRDHSL